jgi:phage N-6-adenine-methyltransferase
MATEATKKDTWATPDPVYDTLDFEFDFDFDVCAQDHTAKCLKYWTIDDDSLSKNWVGDSLGSSVFWCNPPYSKTMPWVEHAIQAQADGGLVVMLVMSDPSVKWFSKALAYCSEVRYIINGRLAFINHLGVAVTGNEKGSVIFIFDPAKIGECQTVYVDRCKFGV